MQQHSAFIISFCLGFSMMTPAAAEKIVIPAALQSVTVYRSGAELMHTATARLEQGNNEVVIGDVSNSIDQTSIRIGCSATVNKDTGILMWNVELAAGESKKFRISYSVKYPKDKILNIN